MKTIFESLGITPLITSAEFAEKKDGMKKNDEVWRNIGIVAEHFDENNTNLLGLVSKKNFHETLLYLNNDEMTATIDGLVRSGQLLSLITRMNELLTVLKNLSPVKRANAVNHLRQLPNFDRWVKLQTNTDNPLGGKAAVYESVQRACSGMRPRRQALQAMALEITPKISIPKVRSSAESLINFFCGEKRHIAEINKSLSRGLALNLFVSDIKFVGKKRAMNLSLAIGDHDIQKIKPQLQAILLDLTSVQGASTAHLLLVSLMLRMMVVRCFFYNDIQSTLLFVVSMNVFSLFKQCETLFKQRNTLFVNKEKQFDIFVLKLSYLSNDYRESINNALDLELNNMELIDCFKNKLKKHAYDLHQTYKTNTFLSNHSYGDVCEANFQDAVDNQIWDVGSDEEFYQTTFENLNDWDIVPDGNESPGDYTSGESPMSVGSDRNIEQSSFMVLS